MSKKDFKSKRPPMGGGHMGGNMGPVEKAKDFKGSTKKLLKYLGGYKIGILIVIVFAIASTVSAIVGPKILGEATTVLFEGVMGKISGEGQGVDFVKIGSIMATLIVLYLFSTAFGYIQGYVMSIISNKLTIKLRTQIYEKMHKLPFSYYDSTTNGEVLSRLTNDVDTISQSFNQSITQIITSITMLVGIIYMMVTISFPMTLISIGSLLLSFIIIIVIVKLSQKHFADQQEYLGKVNAVVEESYSCHNIVKLFNAEGKSFEKFKENNDILYKSAWKANFLSGLMMPIMNFIGNLAYVVVCVVGGYFAINNGISVGDIQAFIQYTRQFTQPIAQLSQISNVIQQTIAASERVFSFFEEKEEIDEALNAKNVCDTKEEENAQNIFVDGNVVFDNVSFGYKKDKIIVNNFNATIKPGQKIAIVGPTGAGKSTVIKLLMRFYDVNQGAILVDGVDIREFKRNELRSAFGMVLQDTWLYNATIEDNIKYGRFSASREEVVRAAKTAQVHHFVKTLPKGYDLVLNEEASNVSGGQKQLITIARAILADPKILILDEATSSVDTRTEVLIQKAMDNLMKGRTSFIIAHRLSTIKNADMILVMDKGDVIEQGNHDELMSNNGFYANLYNSQFSKNV